VVRITILRKLSSESSIETFHLSIGLGVVRSGKGMSDVHGRRDFMEKMIIEMGSTVGNETFGSTMYDKKSIDKK
jgi:hypothetical protein